MSTSKYIGRSRIRRKGQFSKLIVLLSILTVISYTVATFMMIIEGYHVPDSLTYSFFGAFAVELSALAGIKVRDKAEKKYKDIV